MADSFTPTLNLTKPEIDASAETWGQKLNADLDLLDAFATSTNAWMEAQPGKTSSAISAAILAAIPRGVIMAWYGNTSNIPTGWLLCNGLNGTPNLADRFILGTAGVRAPWETGGAFSSSATTSSNGSHAHGGADAAHVLTVNELPVHKHDGYTDTSPNHFHYQQNYANEGIQGGIYQRATNPSLSFGAYIQTSDAGAHSHWVYTGETGAGWGHNHGISQDGNHAHTVSISVVPPYFTLCYIMRA